MDKAREEIGDLARNEEDVVSYALFPQVARRFLEWRAHGVSEEMIKIAAIAGRVALEMDHQPYQPAHEIDAAMTHLGAGLAAVDALDRIVAVLEEPRWTAVSK